MFTVTFKVSGSRIERVLSACAEAGIKNPTIEHLQDAYADMTIARIPQDAAHAILSLTGKKATPGSIREAVLDTLEKMEEETGIGTVMRSALRDRLAVEGQDTQVIGQLITDGYIST